ncbi:MAG: hypothetical protein GKR95_01665 [Gammaproteobacteria bacterium]|nr:hypothetical protein [Gammaproteobacteria bacterium]
MIHQIKLTPKLEHFVNEMIERGRYGSVDELMEAALELLQEQERSNSGRLVELPNNPSLSSLNTFMDDNLQDLMAMLDAKEVEKKDEKQNGER